MGPGPILLSVSRQRVDTPKVGGARNTIVNEFVMHGVSRCLDDQGEKLQGVGLSGAQVGESLPQHDLKASTCLTPRSSWGDDLSPRSLFSWDAQGTQWHRCHPRLLSPSAGGPGGGGPGVQQGAQWPLGAPRRPLGALRGPLGGPRVPSGAQKVVCWWPPARKMPHMATQGSGAG